MKVLFHCRLLKRKTKAPGALAGHPRGSDVLFVDLLRLQEFLHWLPAAELIRGLIIIILRCDTNYES